MDTYKSQKSSIVFVLAGLFDPCGDIGTQGRYVILPIPWNSVEFRDNVSSIINFELNEKNKLESQSKEPPKDQSDDEALTKQIGLRTWIQKKSNGRRLSAKVIDDLSFRVPSVDYQWPSSSPDDEATIRDFELFLFNLLENYV